MFPRRLLPLLFLATAAFSAEDWDAAVTREKPGDFPPLATPWRATYRIGWGGVAAAKANVVISRKGGNFDFAADTATVGAARLLFPLDAVLHSVADAGTLRPLRVEQTEQRRDRTIEERVRFSADSAERTKNVRMRSGKVKGPETKTFTSGALNDFFSCYLALRSQRFQPGQTRTMAVMSPSVPYLITLTYRGPEKARLSSGEVDALKFSVDALSKVGDDGVAKPQKKFRKATVWVSNDDKRELLRVESQVFIGAVFLERE